MYYRFNNMLGRLTKTAQYAAYNPAGLRSALKPEVAGSAVYEYTTKSKEEEKGVENVGAQEKAPVPWTDSGVIPAVEPHHLNLAGLDYVPAKGLYRGIMEKQTYFYGVFWNHGFVHRAKKSDNIILLLYVFAFMWVIKLVSKQVWRVHHK